MSPYDYEKKQKFKQRHFPSLENLRTVQRINSKQFSVTEKDNCFRREARQRQEILFIG